VHHAVRGLDGAWQSELVYSLSAPVRELTLKLDLNHDQPAITFSAGTTVYFASPSVIDVGEHVLLPDTPGQVIPISVSGAHAVQGVVLNVQVADGHPDVPGSSHDGPNITGMDLAGPTTVFGSVANTGNNFIESREQIWVAGTSTSTGTVAADGILAYVTIDTTGWFGEDGPWELKLAGTFNGDTNFQTPAGQVVPTITGGTIRIDRLPVADPGGPYTVEEGGSISLDGAASSDPDAGDTIARFAWDLDGDGVFGETGDSAVNGDEVGVSPAFSAAGSDGPSTWTVWLKVRDSYGGSSSPQPAEITITNAAPELDPVADQSMHIVHALNLQNLPVTFTDAGVSDSHAATVDWGDDSPLAQAVVTMTRGFDSGRGLSRG
jgi:hypothetical protein